MRVPLLFFAGHLLPIYILLIQNTNIRISFFSDFPWYSWLVISLGMLGFTMFSSSMKVIPVKGKPELDHTIGILPYCSKCEEFVYPRTWHCDKCGCCVPRHVVHMLATDSCIGLHELLFVTSGCTFTTIYFVFVLWEISSSLYLHSHTIIEEFAGHILLVLLLIPSLLMFIQMAIYTIGFIRVILSNGIVLESKWWWIFEVFTVQDSSRNPYNAGLFQNIGEFTEPARDLCYHGLTPGPVTDAYCEDWLKYRGIDLKPTIKDPHIVLHTPPPSPEPQSDPEPQPEPELVPGFENV